jgi:predicted nucleic acid-binding protein
MGLKYLIDTNCINPLLLKTNLPVQKSISKGAEIFISIITIIEYLSNRNLSATNKQLFELLVKRSTVLNLYETDSELLQKIISLRKKYNLKTPDAIIDAQAIANKLTLISNDEDFKIIFGLQIVQIKT